MALTTMAVLTLCAFGSLAFIGSLTRSWGPQVYELPPAWWLLPSLLRSEHDVVVGLSATVTLAAFAAGFSILCFATAFIHQAIFPAVADEPKARTVQSDDD